MSDTSEPRTWGFYATDRDHSWDWSNHAFTLGLAFTGLGDTAADALAHARANDAIPGYFIEEPCALIAIPEDAEVAISADELTA